MEKEKEGLRGEFALCNPFTAVRLVGDWEKP
jgi:hypothetical protein